MAKRSLLFAVRALNPAPRVDIAPPKRARGTRSVGPEERGIADAEEDREQDTRDKIQMSFGHVRTSSIRRLSALRS